VLFPDNSTTLRTARSQHADFIGALENSARILDLADHRHADRKRIPLLMTHRSRAFGALISATTLMVVASCSSSTSTTSATQAAPSALASTAASYSAPPTTTSAAPLPDSERWHPAKHLAPAAGWASNPSGLVYENGTYHAFYRHNPSGEDAAGASDWAHATSTDLVNWTEQPVAITGTADSSVLTGSIVVDQDNTSGLGTKDQPPMVAIYTTTGSGEEQAQSLAYSTDHGQTWQEYSDNPVLQAKSSDEPLRDPKVFWYEQGGYWVMVGAVTAAFKVQLFKSKNLTDWTYLSEVSGVGAQAGLWESPDLFPLALDGDAANVKWVMPVSTNSGSAAGGSGVQYFVGSFDGKTFTPEPLGPAGVGAIQPGEMHSWMDWGSDFFGATTFSGAPNGRLVALGWMNNWHYAEAVPTTGWRGSMTLPRELSLATVDGAPRLMETVPAEAATALAGTAPAYSEASLQIPNGSRKLDDDASGTNLLIKATLVPGDGAVAGVTVLGNATGQRGTRIQYVKETGILQVDRTQSGKTDFSGAFSGGAAAAVPLTDGKLNLTIVVDGYGVEVFAGDGKVVLSSLVFPPAGDDKVAVFSGGGKATAENLSVTKLTSTT
jgi:fructan beta-fructosidase